MFAEVKYRLIWVVGFVYSLSHELNFNPNLLGVFVTSFFQYQVCNSSLIVEPIIAFLGQFLNRIFENSGFSLSSPRR